MISRSSRKGPSSRVAPTDTLLMAHARMKLYDVSQLPVLDRAGDRIVGLLDESDLLLAVTRDPAAFRTPCATS